MTRYLKNQTGNILTNMIKPLSEIKPSPINEEIYSSTDQTDLELSLRELGQLEPIVINKKGNIISGHRRYFSMTRLGWSECEVRVEEYENETITLIQYNHHRTKSVSDINNAFRILQKEYKKRLGSSGTRTDLQKGKKQFDSVVKASKTIGIGTSKLKQIRSIYNYEPDLLTEIDKGNISVHQAYKNIQEKYMKDVKKGDDKDLQKNRIKKFLDKENPSVDILVSALKDKFPFSLWDYNSLEISSDKLMGKRDELIDNMNLLKKLDEKEIVIYKKLKEIQRSKFEDNDLKKISNNIYQFSDLSNSEKTLEELKSIKPTLELVEKDFKEFNILRILIHSMEWSSNPGRNLKYIVRDEKSNKYLGVITLGSDVMSIQSRDEYIGWSKENKIEMKRLNNTCIASTIVPVQPFGYNLLLGKLIACLCISERIREDWKNRYGDVLVGITTTSLYGSYSMYNSIPLWKKVGTSKGKIVIKPDDEQYLYWNDWVKKNYPDEYYHSTHSTGPKQNVINLIFRKLGIRSKQYENEQQKGVYFLNLYENSKEFLRGEIKENELVLRDKVKGGIDYVLDWWTPKAVKRYSKLKEEKSLKNEVLWYGEINSTKVESWLRSRGVYVDL